MHGSEFERRIALERNEAVQGALADVLTEINGMQGNEIYRRAWKKLSLRVQKMLSTAKLVNTTL